MATLATLNVSLLLDATQFQAELATQATKLQTFAGNVKSVGSSISGAGRTLTTGLTLPLAGIGVAGSKAAMDYENTMSQIKGLTGDTAAHVDQMSNQILASAADLGQTPQALAEGLYFVESAGIPASQAMDALNVSAKAATAGLGSTQTVADAVTSAMMAYGPANLSASQATDILVGAVKNGKAEASSIAPVLGNVVGMASNMGISFDQVAGSIAAMTNTGQDAATAATSLGGIMDSFAKPAQQQIDAASELGLTYEDLRASIKDKGLLTTLMDLKDRTGGNIDEMAKLFPNVRALRGVLALTGENADSNVAIFNDLKNSTGNLDAAFQQAQSTTKFGLNAALAQGQSILIQVGAVINKALIPVFGTLLGWLKQAAAWFTALAPAQQRLILIIGGIAAAIGPVLLILGGLISAIGAIVGAVAAAVPVIGAILAVLTGPIGLVVLAVGLLAAAWATNFLGIRDIVTNFWQNTLQPLVSQLVTWFQTNIPVAIQALANFWTTVLQPALQAVWGFIQNSLLPLLGALVDVGLAIVKKEVEALAGLWQNVLQPALSAVWTFIETSVIPVLVSVATTISDVLGPPLKWLGDVVLAGLRTSFEGIRDAIQWVVDRLHDLKDAIDNLELPDWLTPGSPTPFELGLRGITDALGDMNRIALPAFNTQLTGLPALSPASAGPSVRHGDISISVTGVPMDEAEIARQVRFARLLESS